MSDNYYNQGYQSSYPQGGYGQQQQPHQQGNQYPSQQSGGYPSQDFGPPRRQDSFGPPQHGGFQHGQAGQQYGAYDASNPQGQSQYYGGGYDQQQYGQQQYGQQQQGQQQGQGYDAYQQNQQYQQQESYGGATQASQGVPQTAPQSSDPNAPNYDPNAPPMTESDRGLIGAALGGFGGHKFGKNQGHGFLGLIGGAIAGSMAEDALKKKKTSHSGGSYGGSQSSWGGKW